MLAKKERYFYHFHSGEVFVVQKGKALPFEEDIALVLDELTRAQYLKGALYQALSE